MISEHKIICKGVLSTVTETEKPLIIPKTNNLQFEKENNFSTVLRL
jgi:hypothetical protein